MSSIQEAFNERELNVDQMNAIREVYTTIPRIRVARDAFVSMVFHCPPQIVLKSMRETMVTTRELDMLIETYWMPWMADMYDWLKMFGVCPWYFGKLRNTIHSIPIVPPYGSGIIKTYMDKKRRQRFKWFWVRDYNDLDTESDPTMYFEVDGRPPSLNGYILSTVATLLPDFRTAKLVRENSEKAWQQQAHQQHIFEMHPPKNMPGDENLATLESFGERIAGQVIRDKESMANLKVNVRMDYLADHLLKSTMKNKGMESKYGQGFYLPTDTKRDAYGLQTASIIQKGTPLPPDYVYKPVPSPNVTANYLAILERLDSMATSVMDVPPHWFEGTNTRTVVGAQSAFRFVNERVKYWIGFFERVTKKAFLVSYGVVIQNELENRVRQISYAALTPERLLGIYADEEVEVHMPCTPIAGPADIRQLYLDGMMDKETAAAHLFTILGVPIQDVSIVEPPILPDSKPIKTQPSIFYFFLEVVFHHFNGQI
jgi:hypothetical protein